MPLAFALGTRFKERENGMTIQNFLFRIYKGWGYLFIFGGGQFRQDNFLLLLL